MNISEYFAKTILHPSQALDNSFKLEFLPLVYCETSKVLLNYPTDEGEYIIVTNDKEFIHCLAVYTLEDTFGSDIPVEMLTLVPYNVNDDIDIEAFSCTHIAKINHGDIR